MAAKLHIFPFSITETITLNYALEVFFLIDFIANWQFAEEIKELKLKESPHFCWDLNPRLPAYYACLNHNTNSATEGC